MKLRTVCNVRKLKLYLTRFFQQEIADSRYIIIQLKLQTVNDNIIKIGENRILDLKNNKELKNYRRNIQGESIQYLSPSYENKVNRIIINYTEISRKEYLNIIKSQKKNKSRVYLLYT